MKVQLQRASDLALRLLGSLDGNTRLASADAVADEISSTINMVRRVVGPLVAAGWVESHRGPGGGYRLVTPLERITLLELIEAIEGPTDDGVCVLVGGPCGTGAICAMHAPWQQARQALVNQLATIPLSASLVTGDVR